MQFGEAFLSLIPQLDQRAVGTTQRQAHQAGERVGKEYAQGMDKGASSGAKSAGAFGQALAVMGAKATIAGAGVASTAPAALQLTAAVVPATGAVLGLVGAYAGLKAISVVAKFATDGVSEAIKGFYNDAKNANDLLDKLNPNARAFATSVINLRPQIDALQESTSGELFGPMIGQMDALTGTYMPLAEKQFPKLAGALGTTAAGFLSAATNGRLFNGISDVFDNTSTAVATGSAHVRELSDGIGVLLSVSSKSLPVMAQGFDRAAEATGNWLVKMADTGKLEQWMNAGFKAVGQLVQIILNLGKVLTSVLGEAGKSNRDFLGTIVDLTAKLAAFFKSVEGNQALKNFFTVTTAISTALRQGLMLVLPQIVESLAILAPAVAPLVGSFLQLVGAVAPLLPIAARLAVVIASVLAGAMSTLATALAPVIAQLTSNGGAGTGMADLTASAEKLGPALNDAASSVQNLTPALNLTAQAIAFMVEHTDTLIKFLPVIIAGFIAWKVAQIAGQVAMAASVPVRIAEIIAMRQQTAALTQLAAAQGLNTVSTVANTGAQTTNTAATIGQRVAALASAAATKVATAAQWLWNVALTANPIGIVIVAIAAFVAAIILLWKNSETFRTIVLAVWGAVKTAIAATADWFVKSVWPAIKATLSALGDAFSWLWKNVIIPVWNGIKIAIDVAWIIIKAIFAAVEAYIKVLATIFTWLWRNILEPAWKGITLAIQVAWKMIEIVFKLIEVGVRLVAAIFDWLWKNVIVPVWNAIKAVIQTQWNLIKAIFDAVIGFFKSTFGPAWDALKNLIIRAWDSIKGPIQTTWNWIKSNVFEPIGTFITKTIPNAFSTGVSAIGKAWDKIRDAAKVPVKFVIDTVLNKGIIAGVNWIADKVGASKISPIPMPFAAGGVLPGYTPGRDVHRFVSATGGALDLSGGEAIMRPEFTRAMGPAFINAANAAARGRGTGGVRDFMSGLMKYGDSAQYKDGGILGTITGGISKAWDAFTNPVESFKKLVSSQLGGVGGAAYGDILKATVNKLVGGVASWISQQFTKFGGAMGSGGGPGNYKAMFAWVKSRFPNAQLFSGLRNTMTLSNHKSLHASGRAIDVTPDRAISNAIIAAFGKNITELISPWKADHVWHGQRPHDYGHALDAQHGVFGNNAHIHWAMKNGGVFKYDNGGWFKPGQVGVNRLSRPEAVLTPEESTGLKAMGTDEISKKLDRLIDAIEENGHTVGGYIRGSGKGMITKARQS